MAGHMTSQHAACHVFKVELCTCVCVTPTISYFFEGKNHIFGHAVVAQVKFNPRRLTENINVSILQMFLLVHINDIYSK